MKKTTIGIVLAMTVIGAALAAETAIAGDWNLTIEFPEGKRVVEMAIVQDNQKLTVTLNTPRGKQVFNGTIQGSDVTWSGKRQTPEGNEITVTYTGRVENDSLKGTVLMGERGLFGWSAARVVKE